MYDGNYSQNKIQDGGEREGMPLACEKVEPAEEERAVKREEARMKGEERGWEGGDGEEQGIL